MLKGLAFILKATRNFKQGGLVIRVILENDCDHSVDNGLKMGWGEEVIKTGGTCWESRGWGCWPKLEQ